MQVREISKQELHVLNDNGSIIAGVNIGYYRPWIYPLCTPSGVNVLREFPPDHGFHNGAFFGHYPVGEGSIKHNFWGAPPFRGDGDNMSENVGRIQSTVELFDSTHDTAEVQLSCIWISKFNDPLIHETRTYMWLFVENTIVFQSISHLLNVSIGPLQFQNTKCSGHTYRLSAKFCPRNEAYITEGFNKVPIERIHCIKPPKKLFSIVNSHDKITFVNNEKHNIFIRDYGLVSINPFYEETKIIARGEQFNFSSSVILS